MKIEIRRIEKSDNLPLAAVIRACLEEHDAAIEGTMYTDPNLEKLYEWFDAPRSAYWVAYAEESVLGGAGIAPLPGADSDVAELQRMFLLPEARGTGTAKKLMQLSLDFAKSQGFEQVYLETLPNMQAAQGLYRSFGFEEIPEALGNTGHHSCDVTMLLQL